MTKRTGPVAPVNRALAELLDSNAVIIDVEDNLSAIIDEAVNGGDLRRIIRLAHYALADNRRVLSRYHSVYRHIEKLK